jgi:hypothetical protein
VPEPAVEDPKISGSSIDELLIRGILRTSPIRSLPIGSVLPPEGSWPVRTGAMSLMRELLLS